MTDEQDKSESRSFQDELRSLKEEMKELKKKVEKQDKNKEKSKEKEHINIGGPKFKFEFDDEDVQFEGVDETLGSYLESVMQGVASNLSNSMKQMAHGFQIDISGPMAQAKRELSREKARIAREVERAARDVERNVRDVEREIRHKEREMKRNLRHGIRYIPLSEEELDSFYDLAPDLTSALSDSKKLILLKALENGPMYQKDLSESTGIAGGTFKHHMDSLQEVKYVNQETVRGRYLITQLGVEALKLSEMLFRRYKFVTDETLRRREEEEVETEFDEEEIETEVENDIQSDADAVGDVQNEEEEG